MKKNIIITLIMLTTLTIFAIYMIPVNDCNATPCQLNEVLPKLVVEQQAVERILSNDKKTMNGGHEIDSVPGLFSGHVTSEGKIIFVLKSGSVVVSEFENLAGKSDWECNIYPEKFSSLPAIKDCGKSLR